MLYVAIFRGSLSSSVQLTINLHQLRNDFVDNQTNDDADHWRIFASPDNNVLKDSVTTYTNTMSDWITQIVKQIEVAGRLTELKNGISP